MVTLPPIFLAGPPTPPLLTGMFAILTFSRDDFSKPGSLRRRTVDVHGYNRDGSALKENFGNSSLLNIGYDYADTKVAGELAVLRYTAQGLDVVNVYPGFMIGPFDHTLQFGRIIQSLQAGKLTFSPPGTASFCDVRAVAQGMLAAAENGKSGHGYNLTGFNRSYHEVFSRVADLVGSKKKPMRVPAPLLKAYGEIAQFTAGFTHRVPEIDPGMAKYLSVPQASNWEKASTELGYHPGDIDLAILDAAAWYDTYLPTSATK